MHSKAKFKWVILALAGLTNTLVVAAPGMSLSVLFPEISSELKLNLVQVGLVWGIGGLPAIFTSLLGGAGIDRVGPRAAMLIGALLVGLSGAARGLANDFLSLLFLVMVAGVLSPLVTMSSFKACSIWFSSRRLGLASGVLSMGMALGFLLGSFLSATFLSPWLGGWRNVMFFYGALAVLFTIPWFFMPPEPQAARREASPAAQVPIGQAIRQVARLKNAWLLGFTLLGFGGCIQASLGYLPLYLRGQGWTGVLADSALSSFHLTSMIFVLPIVLWSDRLQARKKLLMGMGLMAVAGVGALSVTQGWVAWAAIILAGMVRDGFMALFMATIIETEGVGPALAGTATGFAMIFSMLGSVLAPPLGNSFAELAPGLPFLFWAALAALGVMSLSFTRADGAAGAPQPARSMKMEG